MNPGGLYGNARPENFPTVNDYRNPVIAEAMKVMDYVNMFSRGVGRVQEVLRENGNAEAMFDLGKITVFNVVVTENPEDAAMAAAATPGTPMETPMKTPMNILSVLAEHPSMTLPEVANNIGKSHSAVHRACAKLIAQGLLKRIGPDKGGHWEVQK